MLLDVSMLCFVKPHRSGHLLYCSVLTGKSLSSSLLEEVDEYHQYCPLQVGTLEQLLELSFFEGNLTPQNGL